MWQMEMNLNLCLIRIREGWGLYRGSFTVYATALIKPESFLQCSCLMTSLKQSIMLHNSEEVPPPGNWPEPSRAVSMGSYVAGWELSHW